MSEHQPHQFREFAPRLDISINFLWSCSIWCTQGDWIDSSICVLPSDILTKNLTSQSQWSCRESHDKHNTGIKFQGCRKSKKCTRHAWTNSQVKIWQKNYWSMCNYEINPTQGASQNDPTLKRRWRMHCIPSKHGPSYDPSAVPVEQ